MWEGMLLAETRQLLLVLLLKLLLLLLEQELLTLSRADQLEGRLHAGLNGRGVDW